MKRVAILIPSYKRPDVLRYTLEGLYQNTASDNEFQVGLYIGLNKATDPEILVVKEYESKLKSKGIDFKYIFEEKNIGKAAVLNKLFDLYCSGYDYIVTMDNDMYIKAPWLRYLSVSEKIDFELMGISCAGYWVHNPERGLCSSTVVNGSTFYTPQGIGGGIMFFHYPFLDKNKWVDHDAVYGGVDAWMCLKTNKKYVLHCEEDWIFHDPLRCSTPILKSYEDKKQELVRANKRFFPAGWDE